MSGLEVEEIIQPGKKISTTSWSEKILSRDPHPDAEKLSLCSVDVNRGHPLQIACGANNMKAGDKVPVALIGARLPSGFEISKAKIRGIESSGMMCSKKELGISEEHGGLYILDENAEIGQNIVSALNLDVIFEISITPNRGDALSHLGIARELSAIFNLPLHRDPLGDEDGEGHVAEQVAVEIQDKDLCPRYGARPGIHDVKVGPSPDWLKERPWKSRDPLDQQRRRRDQLYHARYRTPDACLRLYKNSPAKKLSSDPPEKTKKSPLSTTLNAVSTARCRSLPTLKNRLQLRESWAVCIHRLPTAPPASCSKPRFSTQLR